MDMYCPNCGSAGKPKTFTPGSFALEVLLWLFFIVPGLIYSIWRLTARYKGCASCGQRGVIPVDSPRARAALSSKP